METPSTVKGYPKTNIYFISGKNSIFRKIMTNTMRKLLVTLLTAALGLPAFSQESSGALTLIPEPVSQQLGAGHFTLPTSIVVEAPAQPELGHTLEELKSRLGTPTGYPVTMTHDAHANATIRLLLNRNTDATLGNEGYTLVSTPDAVTIHANKPAGLFYGLQTFYQLLPKEIESREIVHNVSWTAPCVTITDYPRFGWRGLMFDVARHFFTKQEVEAFIDEMVQYKFNLLHLHLTDDEGWRIEIKSLPRLTQVGAWNV